MCDVLLFQYPRNPRSVSKSTSISTPPESLPDPNSQCARTEFGCFISRRTVLILRSAAHVLFGLSVCEKVLLPELVRGVDLVIGHD